MKYNIRGDKILVTDAIKDYITEKIDKLNKYFDEPDEIIEKYSEYYGKELSREMKISVLKHFNRIVKLNVIDSMVNPKGKIK